MQGHHWLMLVVVLVVGYFLGSKYPGLIGKATAGAVSA